ncbi:MAG: bifunctional phosphoglucose/phosphomannose isomerase [Candidatus Bathyarchaeia archaeon]
MPRTILDDLVKMKEIDKGGMLSYCVNAPKHYEEAAEEARKTKLDSSKPQRIIVAGMGGSAISGELVKDWGKDTVAVPIDVCRDYRLPAHANEETLAFISSYSGETEETLSCLLDAIKKRCKVFCISSNGTLLKIADELRLQTLKIPEGFPSRAALPYLLMPILVFLEKLGLAQNVWEEISEAISVLEHVCSENGPEIALEENPSKSLAAKIDGKIPVIYGFGFYRSVAQRFKQQFNENSKIPAFWNSFPELDHNEIAGWERARRLAKHFSVVLLRDKNEPAEVKCRIEATKEILDSIGMETNEVWSVGRGKLSRMLSAILVGDFASVYLAILRRVDPTSVEAITRIKEAAAKTGTKKKIIEELKGLIKHGLG